ncbi:MAG TPA: hypothetical protein VFY18_09955, partial [Candidatus Limnocylindrales bacterium]|nr:hypothetical protein [Candidatus Limnocylindrales bacterium]
LIGLAANGGRFRLTRDVANITMDGNDVERVEINALGGADHVTVGDLTGTDVSAVIVDLAAAGGTTGDGAADAVTVEGTAGDDTITVTGSGTSAVVSGLQAAVMIEHAEFANDRLDINTDTGVDTVDSSGLAAGVIPLYVNGIPQ